MMTQMIRKQIYIEKRQQQMLKRLAKVRQVSEAEIIRQAIDQQTVNIRSASYHPDPHAWEALHQIINTRRAFGSKDSAYQWKREDAYEERGGYRGRAKSNI
jgi:hypothetical protein